MLSIKGSVSLESKNQGQAYQLKKTLETSKNLKIAPDYGKLPLYFIPNEGQVDKKVFFYAKASKYTLWLTKEGLIFDSTRRMKKDNTESLISNPRDANKPGSFTRVGDVSRLLFRNSNKSPEMVSVDRTEHKVNYFMGRDKSKWRTNIQSSRGILYKELYQNIDLKVYGIENQIEYDFVVKPGGEVSNISFEYRDVEKTKIDKEGNLVVKTEFGEVKHAKPICYQVIRNERVNVGANFEKVTNNTYGFKIEEYNKNYELIIDPLILVYSTYLGGSEDFQTAGMDFGQDIAVDSEGAAYVIGWTMSFDFPTQNPLQGNNAGYQDVFITKMDSSGSFLIYSTYLGGYSSEEGVSIAVDSDGAAYVTGRTYSYNFPTQNPFQESHAGGGDVFITKIDASGSSLIYSTYLGGMDYDIVNGLALDSQGAVYVTGYTESTDFPTQNPFQGTNAGEDDAFITKMNASGDVLIYSSYLGGSTWDYGHGIAVDSEGAAYVTGNTMSFDFPTKNPFQGTNAGDYDAFITKINISGELLIYSTYLGGSSQDCSLPIGCGIAVDSEGTVYVTGFTSSPDFPTKNPYQEIHANGWSDAFITKLCFAYSLTISAGTGGTTDPLPGTYTSCSGTEVIIEAIPDTHYRFTGWSGDESGSDNPITITMDSDKSVTANFILIYPPLNFAGVKVLNRSLSQAEYINDLTWQANPNNVNIAKYRIYLVEGESQNLLVELNSNTFRYWHRRVGKDRQYVYAICAVNNEDREGDPTYITVQ